MTRHDTSSGASGIPPREAFRIVADLDDAVAPDRRGVPRGQLSRRLAAEAGTATAVADRAVADLLARHLVTEIPEDPHPRIWPNRTAAEYKLPDGEYDAGDG